MRTGTGSERNVRKCLARMKEDGTVSVEPNAGPHGANRYQIKFRQFKNCLDQNRAALSAGVTGVQPENCDTQPLSLVPKEGERGSPNTLVDTSVDPPTSAIRSDSEGKAKTTYAPKAPVIVPDWIPLESWNGFLEMRSRLKKPMTDRAKVLLFQKLDQLRKASHDVGRVLDQSTLNSWPDVYEPKTAAVFPQAAPPIPMRRASAEMQRQLSEG